MTPTRPGVTQSDKGEVITSPAYIGRQHGNYPLQDHWRECMRATQPDLWAWIEAKKTKRKIR